MTTLFNRIPTYTDKLTEQGAITRGWYTFWNGLLLGQPTAPVIAVTLPAGPVAVIFYIAPSGGNLLLTGGTGVSVAFSRDGVTYFATGQTAGFFPMAKGDSLKLTYTATPTATFVPR